MKTPAEVYEVLLATARKQAATTAQGKALCSAPTMDQTQIDAISSHAFYLAEHRLLNHDAATGTLGRVDPGLTHDALNEEVITKCRKHAASLATLYARLERDRTTDLDMLLAMIIGNIASYVTMRSDLEDVQDKVRALADECDQMGNDLKGRMTTNGDINAMWVAKQLREIAGPK